MLRKGGLEFEARLDGGLDVRIFDGVTDNAPLIRTVHLSVDETASLVPIAPTTVSTTGNVTVELTPEEVAALHPADVVTEQPPAEGDTADSPLGEIPAPRKKKAKDSEA
jgi:hypothetical protein